MDTGRVIQQCRTVSQLGATVVLQPFLVELDRLETVLGQLGEDAQLLSKQLSPFLRAENPPSTPCEVAKNPEEVSATTITLRNYVSRVRGVVDLLRDMRSRLDF